MEIDGFGQLVHPDDLDWIETPGGNAVKVLRVSSETGSWTARFRAARPIIGLSDWRSMQALQARHRR